MHPRLFSTLILLDPVIQTISGGVLPDSTTDRVGVANASTWRRDLWPTRDAAKTAFAKSPFYQAWDPRVFDRWIRYGLRNLPTAIYPELPEQSDPRNPPVTLLTTKHQEVWTFQRANYGGRDSSGKLVIDRNTHADADPSSHVYPFYRPEPLSTHKKLPHVRPSALWILGEKTSLPLTDILQGAELMGTGVGGSGGMADGRVKSILIPDVGHLVPMEAVDKTAEECVEWLGQEMRRWQTTEDLWQKNYAARSKKDKLMVDEEWKKRVGSLPPKTKARVSPAKL